MAATPPTCSFGYEKPGKQRIFWVRLDGLVEVSQGVVVIVHVVIGTGAAVVLGSLRRINADKPRASPSHAFNPISSIPLIPSKNSPSLCPEPPYLVW